MCANSSLAGTRTRERHSETATYGHAPPTRPAITCTVRMPITDLKRAHAPVYAERPSTPMRILLLMIAVAAAIGVSLTLKGCQEDCIKQEFATANCAGWQNPGNHQHAEHR